jgi:hypothetical protein
VGDYTKSGASTFTHLRSYVEGLWIDPEAARIESDGTIRYYVGDAVGSVNLMLDNSQSVVNTTVGDRKICRYAAFAIDHVAAALPQELPAEPFERPRSLAARDYREPRSHTGFQPLRLASSSASSQATIASLILRRASARVRP